MSTYYKTFHGADLTNLTGAYGHGRYDLSSLPIVLPRLDGATVPCRRGYHFCDRNHVVRHLSHHIAVVQPLGDVVDGGDKLVTCAELRIVSLIETWTPTIARLFACDCAERVVHLTGDPRSRNAIVVSRNYALGLATDDELRAAWAEANAAWVAAWAVWEAAEWAAAVWAAAEAATAAAWVAADAADAADAARAAREAAREAADAARAAREAADAARAAAEEAAAVWAAAEAARAAWEAASERDWQTARLWDYLDGRRTPDGPVTGDDDDDETTSGNRDTCDPRASPTKHGLANSRRSESQHIANREKRATVT